MMYPLVEYAHKIGKNTADFTTVDMVNYTKWWLTQQPKGKELVAMAKQTSYQMKLQAAQKTRLTSDQVIDIEQVDEAEVIDMEVELQKVNEIIEASGADEIVCSMELTRVDVDALLFALATLYNDYDMTGHEYDVSLSGLKEGLEGIE